MSYKGFSIQVDNINKHYHIFSKPSERIKQLLTSIISRVLHRPEKRYFSEFQALKDISFDVPQGSGFGIIGGNGAGKSTL
ncbi:MAG TPA: ATP-binding cassette domain-containing protein, partial [Candidatus Marinimicrobia bacterium]|nr:ATP-binding cassette domain-containing protein [Candidatus Neomarinimicrobiota bacterium]